MASLCLKIACSCIIRKGTNLGTPDLEYPCKSASEDTHIVHIGPHIMVQNHPFIGHSLNKRKCLIFIWRQYWTNIQPQSRTATRSLILEAIKSLKTIAKWSWTMPDNPGTSHVWLVHMVQISNGPGPSFLSLCTGNTPAIWITNIPGTSFLAP